MESTTKSTSPISPWKEMWFVFQKNKPALIGLIILFLILLTIVWGYFFYHQDPFEIIDLPLLPPGENDHLLGTDYLGRNITAGLITGGFSTIIVGITAALITVFLGIIIGGVAGYYGGLPDRVLMKCTEFFQVMPPLLFAMVIVSLFSPTIMTIALAIGISSWPQMARLTRGEFLKISQLEYVAASKSMGSTHFRNIFVVILPNALPPLIVSATLTVGTAILFESGLSFLGLGDPNIMSWGLMIGYNRDYIFEAWWPVTLPGICIFITVLSISLVGDGLTDAINPHQHRGFSD